ncbi:MAG: hypothetical protein AAF518_20270 [Spirochaetota bacterium]
MEEVWQQSFVSGEFTYLWTTFFAVFVLLLLFSKSAREHILFYFLYLLFIFATFFGFFLAYHTPQHQDIQVAKGNYAYHIVEQNTNVSQTYQQQSHSLFCFLLYEKLRFPPLLFLGFGFFYLLIGLESKFCTWSFAVQVFTSFLVIGLLQFFLLFPSEILPQDSLSAYWQTLASNPWLLDNLQYRMYIPMLLILSFAYKDDLVPDVDKNVLHWTFLVFATVIFFNLSQDESVRIVFYVAIGILALYIFRYSLFLPPRTNFAKKIMHAVFLLMLSIIEILYFAHAFAESDLGSYVYLHVFFLLGSVMCLLVYGAHLYIILNISRVAKVCISLFFLIVVPISSIYFFIDSEIGQIFLLFPHLIEVGSGIGLLFFMYIFVQFLPVIINVVKAIQKYFSFFIELLHNHNSSQDSSIDRWAASKVVFTKTNPYWILGTTVVFLAIVFYIYRYEILPIYLFLDCVMIYVFVFGSNFRNLRDLFFEEIP